MEERRKRILTEGLKLFSSRSIEAVSMQQVADASRVGVATLYRYYPKKSTLAAAIGEREWESVFHEVADFFRKEDIPSKSAAEMFEFYLDVYLWLFREHKDLLKFHNNYCSFVFQDNVDDEKPNFFTQRIGHFVELFHLCYQKGQVDGTLRTDMTEEKLFAVSVHIMLNLAAKYAEGILYGDRSNADLYEELLFTKNMILQTCTIQK